MKRTKIDFFSVDANGEHLYEFSRDIELNATKPLTKVVIATSCKIGVPIDKIARHSRNYVFYSSPINNHALKAKNVVKFYCNKSNTK